MNWEILASIGQLAAVVIGIPSIIYLRRFDEAQASLDRALQISPGELGALLDKADVLQMQGRLSDVAAMLAQVPAGITRADLKFNPFWDPLRKDSRFQKLLRSKEE